MIKLARPSAIHSLNGILPFWKPKLVDEKDLFERSHRYLLQDVGASFRFAKPWTVKSVARLPNYTSGVSLVAVGIGCRAASGNVLHNRLNASYRAVIEFSPHLDSSLFTMEKFNNLLSRFIGRFFLNQLKICSFDESFGIEKPFLDPKRFQYPFELTVDNIHCVNVQKSQATLHVDCKPTFLLPHLLGNIEKELNCVIVLKDLCRTKLGPFQQNDCLNLVDKEECTYDLMKQKLKQTKIMNANLIEEFYTNEEWRTL